MCIKPINPSSASFYFLYMNHWNCKLLDFKVLHTPPLPLRVTQQNHIHDPILELYESSVLKYISSMQRIRSGFISVT